MKILHVSDEHIRDRDIDEIAVILNMIVETAKAEQPDLIVSAGDLFDSQDVRMGSRSAIAAVGFISALADIAPVAIILGTSSHDGHAPEILRFAKGNCPIKVASVPEQYILEAGEFKTAEDNDGFGFQPEAIITLIPTPTKQFFQTAAGIETSDKEIGQAMSSLFAGYDAQAAAYPGMPHILVWHGGVSGARLPSGHVRTGMEIEISTDQMRMAGGERNFLGAFYSGGIYPVKVDEQECGFFIHDIGENDFIACMGHIHQPQILAAYGDESKSRYIPAPFTKTVRFKFDLTAGEKVTIPFEGLGGAAVRIEVTTWQDETGQIGKDTITENLKRWGALSVDVRINAVPRETIRAAAVLEAQTLRDEFSEMAKLRGEDLDPEILVMAEKLENLPGEELLKEVAA